MAAMLQCAQCKKFYKGKTGLSSHEKNTGHDVDFPGGNANLESTPVTTAPRPVPAGTGEPATPLVENDQEENIKMAIGQKEEEKTIGCPGCRKHEYREVDLERDIELRDRTIAELKVQLANQTPAEVKQTYPTVEDFVDHCESGNCSVHKQEWDAVKAKIVQSTIDNLPGEALPDKIVESEGLRRGFIPTKIVIP
jgi:hypothetical protein